MSTKRWHANASFADVEDRRRQGRARERPCHARELRATPASDGSARRPSRWSTSRSSQSTSPLGCNSQVSAPLRRLRRPAAGETWRARIEALPPQQSATMSGRCSTSSAAPMHRVVRAPRRGRRASARAAAERVAPLRAARATARRHGLALSPAAARGHEVRATPRSAAARTVARGGISPAQRSQRRRGRRRDAEGSTPGSPFMTPPPAAARPRRAGALDLDAPGAGRRPDCGASAADAALRSRASIGCSRSRLGWPS